MDRGINMKAILLVLLSLSLSAFAGIPYLPIPTNDPGVVGQSLFTKGISGSGYYWDWGTNSGGSNSTVIVASPSIGVVTNSANSFTPFFTPDMTNWLYNIISQWTTNHDAGGYSLTNLNTISATNLNATTLNAGTLNITNPPTFNLSQSTNYAATNLSGLIPGANITFTTNSSGLTIASTGGGSSTGPYITNYSGFGTNITFMGTNTFGGTNAGSYSTIGGNGNFTHYGTNQLFSVQDNNSNVFFQVTGSNDTVTVGSSGTLNINGSANLNGATTITSASVTNAVFQNGMVFTNSASGNWGYLMPTTTNTMMVNIGTNGGGGFNTNITLFPNGSGNTYGASGFSFVDTSTGAVTIALSKVSPFTYVKSNATYSLYLVGNGATNQIDGDLTWVSAIYSGTNWYLRW